MHTDGAGAFAGFGLLSRLGYLSLTIGVRVINHYTGKSGGGKSSVDQIFGICKEELKRRVTKGINDARSLAKALNYKAIKKTVNYAVTFSRNGVSEPTINKSAREGRLQAHSTRTYRYDEDGRPTTVELEEQSYLPVSAINKSIILVGVWPAVEFPYLEIIPNPIRLSTDTAVQGVEAIRAATSLFISKVEKDNGLKERKEVVDQKVKVAKEEEEKRIQYRVEQSEKFAQLCGLKGYKLCPEPGCIRQFTSDARVEQHMSHRSHQCNGRPTSQSSKMIQPSLLTEQTIREMSIDSFLNTVMDTVEDAVNMNEEANVHGNDGGNDAIVRFGWATRCTLKHPRFVPEAMEFFVWLFEQGNKKGGSKCSPATMISFAREYGTHVEIEKEAFWTDAIARSGGVRLLSDAQIPEEWQLKQFIGQSSTAVKQKRKCKAGLHDLAPDQKRIQLVHYLSKITELPVSPQVVADVILGINVDLACMKQKDFVEGIRTLGTFTPLLKRKILEACKQVGKVGEINPSPSFQVPFEEDDPETAQDLYDAEHNNDDIDMEEIIENNNDEV